MKKVNYLFLAAAALMLAACNNDENEMTTGPVAAQITAGIDAPQTRAYDATWENGDAIGITTITDESATKTQYANIKYTTTGDGWFTSTTPIYFQDMEAVTFSAYYPFSGTSGTAAGTISKTITADDQSEVSQKNIDYMFATGATASKTNPDVKFTNDGSTDARFKHKMAKLTFNFTAGNDIDLTDMSDFMVSGLKMDGTFNTATGEATATANPQDLTITETPADANTHTRSLIVFPQDKPDNFRLTITVDGETYAADLPLPDSATTIDASKEYTFNVTVNKIAIYVSSATIEDWDDGGTTDNITAEME